MGKIYIQARRARLKEIMSKIPTIEKAQKILKIPVNKWKGNCHAIACAFVEKKLINGRPVYGHWLGPINPKSFFNNRIGMPFVQHGWIENSENIIIDPTRWVFEATKPYIFVGKDYLGYYDEGGNIFRELNLGKAPSFNPKEKTFKIILSTNARTYIFDLLGDELRDKVSLGQLFWLGNLSPKTLGIYCKEIYQWFQKLNLKAIVPLDNWLKIIG